MDGALLAHQQAGAHLHAAGTQRQGCCQLTAIGNAARRNDGQIHCVHHLRHQRHGGHLAHMAAALGPFGDHGIDAQLLQMLCQHSGSHHGDHLDARRFPHGNIFARVACAGGDHLHAFFHNDLGKLVCLRVHQHDVHAKGLVSELFAPADIFAQGVGIHAARTDDAQCTCIGAGCGKLTGGNVCHAALDDGVFRP